MSEIAQPAVSQPTASRDVFIGLMQRSAAMLIDMVVIFFFAYTLEMALRRPLMEWGPFLPLASNLLAFAYFWLGNGPVGGGATFGKAVLNLQVVTIDGERPGIPGYGQAFKRTLLQFPLIYLGLFQFARPMLGLDPFMGTLGDAIIRTLVIALVISHGYCIYTHPQRAAWYDLWARVRVTSDPTPRDFIKNLALFSEGTYARRAAVQAIYSRYFFLAVCLVFGLAFAPILRNSNRAANLRLIEKISEETPLRDYELQSVAYLSGREFISWKEFMLPDYVPVKAVVPGVTGAAVVELGASQDATRGYAETERMPPAAGDGISSPASIETGVSPATGTGNRSEPEPILFLSWVKRKGSARPEEVPALMPQLEAIRDASSGIIAELEAMGVSSEAPPPTRLVCYFSDRFRFVIFSPGKGLIGFVEGPIDPSEGPLTDVWYEPAL